MAVSSAYRRSSSRQSLSSRLPPRLIALLGVAGTYLLFRLIFVSSSEDTVQVEDAPSAWYTGFIGQKARSLAHSFDISKHSHHGLGVVDNANLDQQKQAAMAAAAVVPPTQQELAERANTKQYGNAEPVRLCPDCDCTVAGSYAASPSFAVPVPKLDPLRDSIASSGSFNTRSVLRYLMHHIPLASTLDGLFLRDNAIAILLTQQFTCPDSLIAYNFTGLALDKPTEYVYTRTGPAGRLQTWEKRMPYMQRHVQMIRDYNALVAEEGFLDGAKGDERQLLWILVEDDAMTEPGLEALLRESGIPFLYFAFGPSRHYGKAQWNVVLRAIEVLRDGFFGDGPVLNMDDDARVLPELLRKLWRLKKAVAFQVGNLHSWPSKGWFVSLPVHMAEIVFGLLGEGPVFENGTLISWEVSWNPKRVFPIDMQGFAINSSMIGPGLPMAPPQYIPFDRQAGESEFLEQIYPNRTDIEPLCDNTKAEMCYYAWHNSWLRDDWEDAWPGE